MKRFWIIVLLFSVACESSKEEKVAPTKSEQTDVPTGQMDPTRVEGRKKEIPSGQMDPAIDKNREKEKLAKRLEELTSPTVVSRPFDLKEVASLKVLGTLDSGISWSDKKGRNTLLFSKAAKKSELTLHIRHYVQGPAGTEVRLDLKEYLYCYRDTYNVELDKTRFSVQDLDQDGVGEAAFAYKVECDDDAPNLYKSFLLEDGKKYKFTGAIKKGNAFALGKPEPNKTLKSQPIFSKYLSENWGKK